MVTGPRTEVPKWADTCLGGCAIHLNTHTPFLCEAHTPVNPQTHTVGPKLTLGEVNLGQACRSARVALAALAYRAHCGTWQAGWVGQAGSVGGTLSYAPSTPKSGSSAQADSKHRGCVTEALCDNIMQWQNMPPGVTARGAGAGPVCDSASGPLLHAGHASPLPSTVETLEGACTQVAQAVRPGQHGDLWAFPPGPLTPVTP